MLSPPAAAADTPEAPEAAPPAPNATELAVRASTTKADGRGGGGGPAKGSGGPTGKSDYGDWQGAAAGFTAKRFRSIRVHTTYPLRWVGSEEELRDSLARPVGRISALMQVPGMTN